MKLFKSYRVDYKDGEQCRDFIYVKDAVKVTLYFLERPDATGIFNVGTGIPRNFNDLASAVFSATGKAKDIEYIDMPEGLEKRYQYYTCAQVDKLRAAGFSEEFATLEDAVQDYVANYLEQDARGESPVPF